MTARTPARGPLAAALTIVAALAAAGPAAAVDGQQVEVLNRWWGKDGSIRHLQIHFQPTVAANGTSTYTLRHGADRLVDLKVKETVGAGATRYPVSVVVPLPEGRYQETAGFVLDGAPAPAEAVTVQDGAGTITVTTGPLRFTVNRSAFNILDTVWFDDNGDRVYSDAERVILPDDGAGRFHGGIVEGCDETRPAASCVDGAAPARRIRRDRQMPAPTITIEESGPLRAVIKAALPTDYRDANDDGTAERHDHGYAVRIYAYAGKSFVKVDYQLQNAARGGDLTQGRYADPFYFDRVNLEWNLALSSPTVRVGRHDGTVFSRALGNGVYLAQESDDVYAIRDAASGNALNGETCSAPADTCQPYGWIDATDGRRGVMASIRNFWQTWPNGLLVNGGGKLAVQLWPGWSSMWRKDPGSFSASGLYWLEDMQASLKEVLLYFHDGAVQEAELFALARTFQYHPVPVVPQGWYAETAVTLDMDGHHALTAPVGPERRLPSYTADELNRSHASYRFGWDNFSLDPSRKNTPDQGGGWAPSMEFFIASESPHHYWEAESYALGELNVRPVWMPGYDYQRDFPALGLDPDGGSYRADGDTADYPIADTAKDAKNWGDEHAWSQPIEEVYYYTASPWIRDYYEFFGEFRQGRLRNQDGWSNPATRAAGHVLSQVMQAYRILGDTGLLPLMHEHVNDRYRREQNPRCGHRTESLPEYRPGPGPDTEAGFEVGYFLRMMVEYMAELDRESQAWADAFNLYAGMVTWNDQRGRWHYRLDRWNPAPCGDTGASSYQTHTLPDPVIWYYWQTGIARYREDTRTYVEQGVPPGSGQRPGTGGWSAWDGDYQARYYDWVMKQPRPDATPPSAPRDLAVTQAGTTATATWASDPDADRYHVVWSDKPISAAYTTDPARSNWWAASAVDPASITSDGTTDRVSFTADVDVVYVAVFAWDAALNLSAMATAASDGRPDPGADDTPPSVPGGLTATARSESAIRLAWNPSTDAESGIDRYRIFRDGASVAETTATTYTDEGLDEATTYSYRVSAVNGANLESARSDPASETTHADTTAPVLSGARASGEPTRVDVTFSEPVEEQSAADPANYAIDRGITVSAAALAPDLVTVILQTSPHVEGVDYTLTVNNVRDRAKTPNTIAPGSQAGYRFESRLVISNIVALSGRPYESAEGLANGHAPFIDRSFVYSEVPPSLLGAAYIRTANDDKTSQEESFLSFDVNQDVTVYVAHDDRYATKPGWLGSFADSGDNLRTDVVMSLHRRDFLAGTVVLGGNVHASEPESNTMYTVIVVPAENPLPTDPPPAPGRLRIRR